MNLNDNIVAAQPRIVFSIALATVIEYAAATYGPETIPRLLAAASEHTSWQTLIPAVFAMPAADFEAGWHRYLAQEYDMHAEVATP